MSLRNNIPMLLDYWQGHRAHLMHNHDMFTIYEGELAKYLEVDLKAQLGPESYAAIKHRIPPINILKKLIDKLAKIYQQAPIRTVEGGGESDQELLAWYEDFFSVNQKMNQADEFFNLFKSTLIQPYLDPVAMLPRLRAVPSDRFLPFSDDEIDPTRMTQLIVWVGEIGKRNKYHVYSDDEFYIIDDKGDILVDEMAMLENPGINPYGQIPFVYMSRSAHRLIPLHDSDTLRMTKLIPVLLADLNFASMFNSFSILYALNVNMGDFKRAPNAIWFLQGDPDGEKKPEIGAIKPDADISDTLELIQAELAMWLNSRGVRPGQIAGMSPESPASSGISKMIDEMDTSEQRQKSVQYFQQAESDLWELVLKRMHPYWAERGMIDNNARFTPAAEVVTRFAEQLPLISRMEVVNTQKAELEAGLTTKARAIRVLNPELTDEQVDELIAEIEAGDKVEMPPVPPPFMQDENEDGADQDDNSDS